MSFKLVLKQIQAVCFMNWCQETVAYDWVGHMEGSVAKISFLSMEQYIVSAGVADSRHIVFQYVRVMRCKNFH